MRELDTFTAAYVEAILFAETDESTPQGGNPLDQNYGPEDFADEAMDQIVRECEAFQKAHWELIQGDLVRAGHDFWFNRVGHGCGFWDGDWPEPAATILDNASTAAGHRDVYVGDDGKLYLSPG